MSRALLYVIPHHLTDSEVQFRPGSRYRDCFLLGRDGVTPEQTVVGEWSEKSFMYEPVATFTAYEEALRWTNALLRGGGGYEVRTLQN